MGKPPPGEHRNSHEVWFHGSYLLCPCLKFISYCDAFCQTDHGSLSHVGIDGEARLAGPLRDATGRTVVTMRLARRSRPNVQALCNGRGIGSRDTRSLHSLARAPTPMSSLR